MSGEGERFIRELCRTGHDAKVRIRQSEWVPNAKHVHVEVDQAWAATEITEELIERAALDVVDHMILKLARRALNTDRSTAGSSTPCCRWDA